MTCIEQLSEGEGVIMRSTTISADLDHRATEVSFFSRRSVSDVTCILCSMLMDDELSANLASVDS